MTGTFEGEKCDILAFSELSGAKHFVVLNAVIWRFLNEVGVKLLLLRGSGFRQYDCSDVWCWVLCDDI
jgi:hypothetical protein